MVTAKSAASINSFKKYLVNSCDIPYLGQVLVVSGKESNINAGLDIQEDLNNPIGMKSSGGGEGRLWVEGKAGIFPHCSQCLQNTACGKGEGVPRNLHLCPYGKGGRDLWGGVQKGVARSLET